MPENYGRYQIVEEIGRGSMGVVYKAYDPEIDRYIALKVLRHDRVTSKAFLQRFLKEARAIGRLSHPNIVTVYDVGQDHGTVFIAMELLKGRSLSDLLKKGALPTDQSIRIGLQVAKALEYAHEHGIIHRDIKPSNIIISSSGIAKLTDFGIAHIEDSNIPRQTQAGEILGTPAYMSPEQILGKSISGCTDIFSLGIVIYEMVTGTRPFNGKNLSAIFNAITTLKPIPPHKVNHSISTGLSHIVMKCLEKDPAKRFKTATVLAQELEKLLEEKGPSKSSLFQTIIKEKINWLIVIIFIFLIAIGYLSLRQTIFKPTKPLTNAILDISTIPPAARVFIDGDFEGLSPVVVRVIPGPHNIKISQDGYYEWEAQVKVKKDGVTPLKIKLINMEGDNKLLNRRSEP